VAEEAGPRDRHQGCRRLARRRPPTAQPVDSPLCAMCVFHENMYMWLKK
jgi:hypothetical protein